MENVGDVYLGDGWDGGRTTNTCRVDYISQRTMRENTIQKKIMVAVSKIGTTIFRNNVGKAWTGKANRTEDGGVYIADARILHAGLIKGSSDLIGWTSVCIDGKKYAIFTAIEIKTNKGKTTPEQDRFIEAVRNAGGIAGVARSEDEAVELVKKGMK
jgi:hypothetical protein